MNQPPTPREHVKRVFRENTLLALNLPPRVDSALGCLCDAVLADAQVREEIESDIRNDLTLTVAACLQVIEKEQS